MLSFLGLFQNSHGTICTHNCIAHLFCLFAIIKSSRQDSYQKNELGQVISHTQASKMPGSLRSLSTLTACCFCIPTKIGAMLIAILGLLHCELLCAALLFLESFKDPPGPQPEHFGDDLLANNLCCWCHPWPDVFWRPPEELLTNQIVGGILSNLAHD